MGDYEELRDEMQYYENEHYNELRKLEAEENASPTLKADRDAWKARAEKAEEAIADIKSLRGNSAPCLICKFDDLIGCCHKNHCKENNEYFEWRGEEGAK